MFLLPNQGLPIYLSSACCLYNTKPSFQQKNLQLQNGIINFAYEKEETVQELTIPEIIIQPSDPQDFRKSVTKNNGNVNGSCLSTPKKNPSFEKTVIESDTESESSEEHFIKVEVHRENEEDMDQNEQSRKKKDLATLEGIDPEYIKIYFNFYSDESNQNPNIPNEITEKLRKVSTISIEEFLRNPKRSNQTDFTLLSQINLTEIKKYLQAKDKPERNLSIPKITEETLDKINRETIEDYLKIKQEQNLQVLKEIELIHIRNYAEGTKHANNSTIPKDIGDKLGKIDMATIEIYLRTQEEIEKEKPNQLEPIRNTSNLVDIEKTLEVETQDKKEQSELTGKCSSTVEGFTENKKNSVNQILREISVEHIQIYLDSLENSSEIFLPTSIEEKLRDISKETIENYISSECYQNYERDLQLLKKIPLEQIQCFLESIEDENYILDIPKETQDTLRNVNIQTIREFLEKEDNYSDEAVLEALNKVISEEENRQLALEERQVLESLDRIVIEQQEISSEEEEKDEKKKCVKDFETGESFKKDQEVSEVKNDLWPIGVEIEKSSMEENKTNELLEKTFIPNSPPLPPENFLKLSPIVQKHSILLPERTEATSTLSTVNVPTSPPLPPEDFLLISPFQIKKNNQNSEKKDASPPYINSIQAEQTTRETTNQESKTIPTPPPIKNLPVAVKMPLVTINDYTLRNTILKKVPVPAPRKLTPKTNEELNDNVKTGTKGYDQIKEKLNVLLQNFKPLVLTNKDKDSPTTPEKEEVSEIITKVEETKQEVTQQEEIPDNYARTTDFKKKLGTLILKNSFKAKNDPSVRNLRQKYLKVEKESISEVTNEEQETQKDTETQKDVEKEIKIPKNVQKSLEEANKEHRKKMIATLRSIKLRSTPTLDNISFESKENSKSDSSTNQKENSPERHQKNSDTTLPQITTKIDPLTQNKLTNQNKDEPQTKKNSQVITKNNVQRTNSKPQKEVAQNDQSLDEQMNKINGEIELKNKLQNEENSEKVKLPKNVEKDLTNDIETHKKRMIATLKSIKLRKTGLILSEDEQNQIR